MKRKLIALFVLLGSAGLAQAERIVIRKKIFTPMTSRANAHGAKKTIDTHRFR